MVDAFAPANPTENERFFVMPVRRDEKGDRLPYSFFRRVAEQKLGAVIPARNYAIEVFGKDGVGRRLNNRGLMLGGAFPSQPLSRLQRIGLSLGDLHSHASRPGDFRPIMCLS